MGTLLKQATLLELEPARVQVGDLRIQDGRIQASGPLLSPQPGDEVLDLSGKCVMPGLVAGHTLLHRSLLQTQPALLAAGAERALDLDAVQLSATVGALWALQHGVTTVVDQHSSPGAVQGSLIRVARGINEVGLRGVLSYQVTDAHGPKVREQALEETVGFARKAQGRFRGAVGAHASWTLSDEALQGLRRALEATGASFHVSVGETQEDERQSLEQFKETPVARLLRAQLITSRARVAHVVHASWPDLSELLTSGAWIVHVPRASLEASGGLAPTGKFGARAALGSGGWRADILAEAQLAALLAQHAGQPIDALRYLANGQRMASELFGQPLGTLREGATADLVVLDLRPSTPLTAEGLWLQLGRGFSSRAVEAVMVDGVWRLWARKPLTVQLEALMAQVPETVHALESRLASPG